MLAVWPCSLAASAQDIQDETLADRPIAQVRFEGLERTNEQLVRNNLTTAPGQPFDASGVTADIETMRRLGRFESIIVEVELNTDGTVDVIYSFEEQPLISAVQVIGNTAVSDQELLKVVPLYAGGPRDNFLLEQSVLRIKTIYRDKGYYLAEVKVDESRLQDSGILILKIIEGPRVRIKAVEFVGNSSIPAKELSAEITTRPYIPFFRKGQLEPEMIIDDVAKLDRFYKDRGFVDVRVDSRVMLAPNNREAKVVFLVDEGRRYRLRDVTIVPPPPGTAPLVFSKSQIRDLFTIHTGDDYRQNAVKRSIERLEQAYQLMGYIDARIEASEVRIGESPDVDMMLRIYEGPAVTAGLLKIQGNFLTQDKVIRRLVRIEPGRPLDGRELELAERRLQSSRLFGNVRLTAQRPAGGDPNVRDVLVEVEERNTGSFNFGAGLSSDAGVFGEISMNQANFDIADWPLSWDELVTARAFRGAGQTMDIRLTPGTEVSAYSFSIGEPHLFNTDISTQFTGAYRNRYYSTYHEERSTMSLTFGRRLGDVWQANLTGRFENIQLRDFAGSTPIEVYEDRGPDNLMNFTASVTRSTFNHYFQPSRGSRLSLNVSPTWITNTGQFYVELDSRLTSYLTISEDFLGRKSILKLSAQIGTIIGDRAPTFERYYLGGRTFRGFQFRTISPKAAGTIANPTTPANDPIGGDFLFFAGAQYEFPVIGESFKAVVFMDSGTVETEFSFEQYRVSVGMGIRLYIPQLGPTPLAFDFGFPILKQEEDREQLFSFSMALPF